MLHAADGCKRSDAASHSAKRAMNLLSGIDRNFIAYIFVCVGNPYMAGNEVRP